MRTEGRSRGWQDKARTVLFLLTAAAVAACGPLVNLSGGKPANLYALTSASGLAAPTTFPDMALMVEEPKTSAAFDTQGIALMPEAREINYYAGAKWVDRAPKMVQTLLMTSFEGTGAFRDVGGESMALAANYRLSTDLRAFNADYTGGGSPVVHISIMGKLFATRPLHLAGTRLISVEELVGSDKLQDIIAAFDRANESATTKLVDWTIKTVAASKSDQSTAP